MKLLKMLFFVLALTGIALAQRPPSPGVTGTTSAPTRSQNLYFGYMYERSDFTAPIQNYNGFSVQYDFMPKKHFGLAADYSASWSNLSSHEWKLLLGPRMQFGEHTSSFGVTPWFGYGSLVYGTPTFPHIPESGFAYGIGGDWTVKLTKRWSYRVGGDYLKVPYGDNHADWFRFTGGLVMKF
jgi:hypothetical protein